MSYTQKQLESLPKWAQSHIENLTRDRDKLSRLLDKQMSTQEVTPIWTMVHRPADEPTNRAPVTDRLYYPIEHSFMIEWEGIKVDVILREGCIDFQFDPAGKCASGDVCIRPVSYNKLEVLHRDNMRR